MLSGAALATAGDRDPVTALTNLLEADANDHRRTRRSAGHPRAGIGARPGPRPSPIAASTPAAPDGAPRRGNRCTGPSRFLKSSTRPEPGFDRDGRQPAVPRRSAHHRRSRHQLPKPCHRLDRLAGTRGSADLVAYFFLNATKTARSLGFLATNTIAQGDTSESRPNPDHRRRMDHPPRRAVKPPGPGDTSLEIAKVWATSHPWNGLRLLDGRQVAEIDEMLLSTASIRVAQSAPRRQRRQSPSKAPSCSEPTVSP